MDTTLDPKAYALTKSLRHAETEGEADPYNARGKSGEFGAYQFMPDTYKAYARKYIGDENAPPTVENQNKIAYSFVKEKKDQGYSPAQIASMWNAGEGRPNAYKEGHSGVNSLGVSYDTPGYAKKVSNYYRQFSGNVGAAVSQVAPEKLGDKLENRLQSIGEAATEAGKGVSQIVQGKFGRGLIDLGEGALRAFGGIAGGIGDAAGTAISAVTPDFIEKPIVEAIGKVAGGAANSRTGQSIARAYGELDPELRKDLEAVGNIATVVPIGKGAGLVAKGAREAIPTATRAIAKTEGLAGKAARQSLVKEALEVVAPKETLKVKKQAIKSGRASAGGAFSEASIGPDARTIRAAEAAAGIVKKNRTGIENAAAVKEAIGEAAVKLEKDIKSLEVVPIVQQEEMDAILTRALKEIGENPTMVGNAEVSATRILNKFKSFLPPGDVTASDLLKARKKLDNWIESLSGGSTVFDPAYENAKTIALRAIRQGANDLIAMKAPSVAVKELLARQSALYDALENISAKAVKEIGTTGADRFIKRHPRATGLIKTAGSAAATGLGVGSVSNLFSEK